MDTETVPEEILVDPCPNCKTKGGHTYIIPVQRMMMYAYMDVPPPVEHRAFDVIFRCPVSGTLFKVTVRMRESMLDSIISVGEPTVKAPKGKLDG